MPPLEECCVLIPCNTLEDFPAELADAAARGLLAAWTAPWHPQLLAASGKIPAWYRADTPPPPSVGRVFFLPEVSQDLLPHDFETTHAPEAAGIVLTATHRRDFLQAPPWSRWGWDLTRDAPPEPSAEPSAEQRPVRPADFFALGYTLLQVQLMTRQLRYTSNLDELDFAEQAVSAARAWEAGRPAEAAAALHRAFDMLAEERDHYFASDPHLVDLTLLAESTLGGGLATTLADPSPRNLLIDAALAEQLQQQAPAEVDTIRQRLAAGTLGLAGGASPLPISLDQLTASEVAEWVADGKDRFAQVFGTMPDAFAKFDGGIPGDFVQWLVAAGYTGAIPLDFLRGTGYRDESKLHWQGGAAELESLVAKPINAATSAGFLKLGATLGAAVDCGDVATALLVHWPGESCEAYEDLQRAAGWGLALGRFWTLGGYFHEGEKPYHHFQTSAAEADGQWLTQTAEQAAATAAPLSQTAAHQRLRAAGEASRITAATTRLAGGEASLAAAPPTDSAALDEAATALGRQLVALSGQPAATGQLVINPHSTPLRVAVTLSGHPPKVEQPVFAAHPLPGGRSVAFLDVPAHGFATAVPAKKSPTKRWFRRPTALATGQTLSNEFMEVMIGDDGSIAAVHSGAVRGNRFSWQLCHYDRRASTPYTTMRAEQIEVSEANPAFGEVTCRGKLLRDDQPAGDFVLRYRLACGSRFLEVSGELQHAVPLDGLPWETFYAGRCAVASDAANAKVIVRDKLHRARGRRLDAPAGVVLDEPDRTLLVAADGLPAHRFSNRRMLDTLLPVTPAESTGFRLRYGFDVKQPVATARALLAPPPVVALAEAIPPTGGGWLLQVESRRVVLTDCRPDPAGNAHAFVLRLVETSGKFVKSRLRFFRDPQAAERLIDGKALEIEGDAVTFSLSGHETTEIRVTVS